MKEKFNYIHKFGMKISIATIIFSLISIILNLNIAELSNKFAELGMYLLFWLIISKSLYLLAKKFTIKNKFYTLLRTNNTFQRKQGLIIFNLFCAHSIYRISYIFSDRKLLFIQVISVIIPILILLYLELTSIKSIQSKLRFWKKSHSIVWVIIPLLFIHFLIIGSNPLKIVLMTFFLILISFFEYLFLNKKSGFKHIALVIIAMIVVYLELIVI